MSLRLAGAPEIAEMAPGENRQPGYTAPLHLSGRQRGVGARPGLDGGTRYVARAPATRRDRGRMAPPCRDPTRHVRGHWAVSGITSCNFILSTASPDACSAALPSQGLIHHDLSKACLTTAPDAIPRVVLLGRLAIYGPRAARLHEEIVPVTARWIEPVRRQTALTPYGRSGGTDDPGFSANSTRPGGAIQHSGTGSDPAWRRRHKPISRICGPTSTNAPPNSPSGPKHRLAERAATGSPQHDGTATSGSASASLAQAGSRRPPDDAWTSIRSSGVSEMPTAAPGHDVLKPSRMNL